jgi:hypothetical protein
MADLPAGVTKLSYTGSATEYDITADGEISFKLWGGGGSGGGVFNSPATDAVKGGGGGFVKGTLQVQAGDVVKIEVGQGGQKSTGNPANFGSVGGSGGAGGWPDGGNGGANPYTANGGGGGSTRLYLNNVLMAVAGAGGGSGGVDGRGPGVGGGLTAGDGAATAAGCGTGGSQSAGGVNGFTPAEASYHGASLDGGNGWPTAVASVATSNDATGGGGGGGYYGGGGGGRAGGYGSAGGGGSSFTDASVTDVTHEQGALHIPGGDDDLDYTAGVGRGGTSGTTAAALNPGGNGQAVLIYAAPLDVSEPVVRGYTGAAEVYEVQSDGYLEIKAWGAGGGGGVVHSSIRTTGYFTGGGGYARGVLPVAAGDIIRVEVGQGGRRAESETVGSAGGWPDGGRGTQGSTTAGGNFYRGGGGGGSSRVYLNDVLILVAGASGGGCRGYGGAGGGETGGTGNAGATGGSQSAGGSVGGAFLRGADAPVSPTAGSSSGGGGGGYYGGGYDGDATNVAGGGGGSSYRNTSVAAFGEVAQGANSSAGTAAKTDDVDYVANVGKGGQTYAGPTTTTHGNDGMVVIRGNDGADYALVQEEQTGIVASGASQEWVIPANGVFKADMWGAGGGGGLSTIVAGPYPPGGAGGHTYVEVPVLEGDVLRVEVGKGGLRGRLPNSPVGGGWPDGGHAGSGTTGSSACGSGGGSTRIFVNDILVAVAGGGGGGGIPGRGATPGAGGGESGTTSVDSASAANAATGGSQSAGGVNVSYPDDAGYKGGYLQGGNGRPAGVAEGTADSRNAAGGGGGYYGGGGAGLSGSYFRAGGGGSGYVQSGLAGETTAGSAGVPPETSNPNYPGGNVGYGGNGSGAGGTVQDGHDGFVSYYYEPLSYVVGAIGTVTRSGVIDATVTGAVDKSADIGTVAISAITGIGDGGTVVDALQGPIEVAITAPIGVGRVQNGWEGDLPGPVTITAPSAIADTAVYAIGGIGTITILSLIEGAPEQEANVVLDLVFEFDGGVEITTELEASATGLAALDGSFGDAVVITPVNGFYSSEDQDTEVDFGNDITVTPLEGYAAQAIVEPELPHAFTTESLLEATATGAAAISARISFIPENGQGGGVGVGKIEATPSTPDMEVSGELGRVSIDPILGVGLSGDDVVLAVGTMPDRVLLEWTNTNDNQATGEGMAFAVLNAGGSSNPADNYLFRIWRNTNIDGSAVGAATVTADISATVTFAAPQGVTVRGQNILAPIGTIFVRRTLGGAGDDPAFEGDALAGADLADMPVIITPPESEYGVEGEATGQGQLTIVILPPEGSADVGQEIGFDLPGPIVLTAPEGAGWAVDPGSEASADLTAVVTLLPPEAQPTISLTVALPGPVAVSPVTTAFRVIATAGTALFVRQVSGEAVFRRVENAVAVVEDRIERTAVIRG